MPVRDIEPEGTYYELVAFRPVIIGFFPDPGPGQVMRACRARILCYPVERIFIPVAPDNRVSRIGAKIVLVKAHTVKSGPVYLVIIGTGDYFFTPEPPELAALPQYIGPVLHAICLCFREPSITVIDIIRPPRRIISAVSAVKIICRQDMIYRLPVFLSFIYSRRGQPLIAYVRVLPEIRKPRVYIHPLDVIRPCLY